MKISTYIMAPELVPTAYFTKSFQWGCVSVYLSHTTATQRLGKHVFKVKKHTQQVEGALNATFYIAKCKDKTVTGREGT
jgi:hypothetical protein